MNLSSFGKLPLVVFLASSLFCDAFTNIFLNPENSVRVVVQSNPSMQRNGHASGLFALRNEDGSIQDNPTVVGDEWETAEESSMNSKVLKFLDVKYPTFYKLLVRDNDGFMKELQSSKEHTIFVPSEEAMEALGAKKLQQLLDPRNEEIRDKMGLYHLIVGKAVSATELRTEDWTKGRPKDGSKPQTLIAAVVTNVGEVPVGRSKSGGILGTDLGAKEDGDVVIGPNAQITQSFQVEGCLVHEMDNLISPLALWRYCDQLRIPGF